MKIKIKTKDLSNAIKIIKPLIGKSEIIELSIKDKILYGAGSNDGVFISTKIVELDQVDDYGFVPILGIQAICNDISSEYLTIQTKVGAAKVSDGKGFERVLKYKDIKESISNSKAEPTRRIHIPTPAQFRSALLGIAPALDKSINDVTTEITSISLALQQIKFTIKDNQISLIGASNNRISQSQFLIDEEIEFDSTIPFTAAGDLVRLLKEAGEDCYFGFSDNHFFFQTDRINYRTTRQTTQFVTLPDQFWIEPSIKVSMETAKLKEAINLVGWGVSGSDGIRFDVKDKVVLIYSVTSLGEEGQFKIPTDYKGESFSVILMKNLIKDVINIGSSIELSFDIGANNVFFLCENNGVEFKHAVARMGE